MIEAWFAAVEASALAEHLRTARWSYAAVNAAHIFGIALLIGAIAPLDLRLLGLWRDIPLPALARVLVPVAGAGLAIAVIAGLLLFSVRAREYSDIVFLQAKLVLVAIGTLAALVLVRTHGRTLSGAGAGATPLAVFGAVSLSCWIGALVCGRLIAFATG